MLVISLRVIVVVEISLDMKVVIRYFIIRSDVPQGTILIPPLENYIHISNDIQIYYSLKT